MILNNEEEHGVFAISLVEEPAMEDEFVLFSRDEDMKFSKVDEEQQLIMGLIMEPNKKIFRKGSGGYDVYADVETISQISQLYMKNGYQNDITISHDKKVDKGVTIVESWIVLDSQKDKSVLFGKEYKVGSWVGILKVEDKDIWEEYKNSDEIKGFSIEGNFQLQEVDEDIEFTKEEISMILNRLDILDNE